MFILAGQACVLFCLTALHLESRPNLKESKFTMELICALPISQSRLLGGEDFLVVRLVLIKRYGVFYHRGIVSNKLLVLLCISRHVLRWCRYLLDYLQSWCFSAMETTSNIDHCHRIEDRIERQLRGQ